MVYKVYNGYMIYIYNKCNAYTSGVECVKSSRFLFRIQKSAQVILPPFSSWRIKLYELLVHWWLINLNKALLLGELGVILDLLKEKTCPYGKSATTGESMKGIVVIFWWFLKQIHDMDIE